MRSAFVLLLFFVVKLNAQQVDFSLSFKGEPFILDKGYFHEKLDDTIRISKLQFYISNIEIIGEDQKIVEAEKKHCLLDVRDLESFNIEVSESMPTKVKQIRFNLGVDSLTNVSGAFGEDLDPTKGMYWSWQSGYINLKLEGISQKNNNHFQYHLGGYRSPFKAVALVELDVSSGQAIKVNLPIDLFIYQLLTHNKGDILSPSIAAVELSKKIAQAFRVENEN